MKNGISDTYFLLRSKMKVAGGWRYVGLVRNGAHLLMHDQFRARRFLSLEEACKYAGKIRQIFGEFDIEMRTAS
ncbi:MAG: hypothetical protein V4695_12640 [Pseudomonadota bacterium]